MNGLECGLEADFSTLIIDNRSRLLRHRDQAFPQIINPYPGAGQSVDTLGCAIFFEIDVPDRQVLILLA